MYELNSKIEKKMVAMIVGIPGLLDMIGKQIPENLKNFGITL